MPSIAFTSMLSCHKAFYPTQRQTVLEATFDLSFSEKREKQNTNMRSLLAEFKSELLSSLLKRILFTLASEVFTY